MRAESSFGFTNWEGVGVERLVRIVREGEGSCQLERVRDVEDMGELCELLCEREGRTELCEWEQFGSCSLSVWVGDEKGVRELGREGLWVSSELERNGGNGFLCMRS
ncbi:hypothetical protein MA16_Dca021149 [Dendrobium catenatum]|uniref:Uncharacterized protein n=1 Tax=Dendrobium catenatum TaxID=906689 RepID=A0A2I0WK47_9ASPA|nr:hypothetical protein MA16_Dca021149 [Dendrobium catenatum]